MILPPKFPSASNPSSLVHHLSGPNMFTSSFPFEKDTTANHLTDRHSISISLHVFQGLFPFTFASMLDSLVRVSRRVDKYYLKKSESKLMLSFIIIFKSFFKFLSIIECFFYSSKLKYTISNIFLSWNSFVVLKKFIFFPYYTIYYINKYN